MTPPLPATPLSAEEEHDLRSAVSSGPAITPDGRMIDRLLATLDAERIAATAQIEEMREAIKTLRRWNKRSVPGGYHVNLAEVLALIDTALAEAPARTPVLDFDPWGPGRPPARPVLDNCPNCGSDFHEMGIVAVFAEAAARPTTAPPLDLALDPNAPPLGLAPYPSAPARPPVLDGAARIAAERRRQIEREGWDTEHDDDVHGPGSLALAAASYALPEKVRGGDPPSIWPWEDRWWKPGPTRLRELEKAGALIAAEIDLLEREAARLAEPRIPEASDQGEPR